MEITAISLSRKAARKKADCILDQWLWRRGDQTWQGRLSKQALDVLARELRAAASRHMSVAVYVEGKNAGRPAFIVGSRAPFDADGHVAIGTSRRKRAPGWLTADMRRLVAAVELAALLHDLGKSCVSFQSKLRAAVSGGSGAIADPVRHELLSALIVDALAGVGPGQGMSDREILDLLRKNPGAALDSAYRLAVGKASSLFDAGGSGPLVFDMLRNEDRFPFFADVLRLIATHHRLLSADLGIVQATHHIHPGAWRDSGAGALDHAPHPALWRNDAWTKALTRVCSGISDPAAAPNVYAYGRLALMIGDQLASRLGSANRNSDSDVLVANTGQRMNENRRTVTVLAEPLSEHLLSVARQARRAILTLLREQERFPRIASEQTPIALDVPAVTGRFAWQGAGADAIRKAHTSLSSSLDDGVPRSHGFFGTIFAGTGSGKTRACPTLMRAVAPREGLRFNLALGLRTLTLQSGSEYVRDIGFMRGHVSVLVGDTLSQTLHGLNGAGTIPGIGTDAEPDEQVGELADVPDDAVPASDPAGENDEESVSGEWLSNLAAACPDDLHDTPLPAMVDQVYEADPRARKLLKAPVLVSTIDQLMLAADARRGRHLAAMLRVATADLILDEIDAYSPEDLAAIGRLIYLCGAFGRRVFLSSATVAPNIVRSFFAAYREGLLAYRQLHGESGAAAGAPVMAGWFTEIPGLTQTGQVLDAGDFIRRHDQVIGAVISGMDLMPARRRAVLIAPNDAGETPAPGPEAAFSSMVSAARDLHQRWNFDIDGVRASIGLMRFSTVRNCREMVRYIARNGICDALTGLVCYHARLFGVVRFQTEQVLDGLLKRKQGLDGNDGVRSHPVMRRLVREAKARGLRDVIMVVVTTPIEETGRDHDFDWGVLEPSSTRSLIQCAGRIWRHRPGLSASSENMAILDRPLRAYREIMTSGAYTWPGVETPPGGVKLIQPRRLSDVRFDRLFDMASVRNSIDARHCLSVPEPGTCELAAVEHGLVDSFLAGRDRALSLEWYVAGGKDRLFAAEHAENRRFRRSQSEREFFLEWDFTERTGVWREIAEVQDRWGRPERRAIQTRQVSGPIDTVTPCDTVVWAVEVSLHEALLWLRRYFQHCSDIGFCANLLSFRIASRNVNEEFECGTIMGADRRRDPES